MNLPCSEFTAQLISDLDLGHIQGSSLVGLTSPALDWPIYVNYSPAKVSRFLVVYDTTGNLGSQSMRSGLAFTKEGIQVKSQAGSHELCYGILDMLLTALVGITGRTVTVGVISTSIKSISNTSTIMRNGRVPPEYTQFSATLNLSVNHTLL